MASVGVWLNALSDEIYVTETKFSGQSITLYHIGVGQKVLGVSPVSENSFSS